VTKYKYVGLHRLKINGCVFHPGAELELDSLSGLNGKDFVKIRARDEEIDRSVKKNKPKKYGGN